MVDVARCVRQASVRSLIFPSTQTAKGDLVQHRAVPTIKEHRCARTAVQSIAKTAAAIRGRGSCKWRLPVARLAKASPGQQRALLSANFRAVHPNPPLSDPITAPPLSETQSHRSSTCSTGCRTSPRGRGAFSFGAERRHNRWLDRASCRVRLCPTLRLLTRKSDRRKST